MTENRTPRQPAGALRGSDAGRTVVLKGWVARRRDLGELIFLDIRDRSGIVQTVFDRARCPGEAVDAASGARSEDVVEIEGAVVPRGEGQRNAELPTGDVEVVASRLAFLARSETPPFTVEDRTNATEELRLEYRYLDLRRPAMLRNFVLRDEIAFRVRRVLHDRGFLEVETPMLTRSTPEGARDFLVPSRVHRGRWYALPQSPQLFKQILMVSGFERYFQIARCFRDEDLRADRQFEFTQIDLEISFPTEEDVFDTVEAFLVEAFAAAGIKAARPFPRLTYRDAMDRYGTDRPDLRYELPLTNLTDAAAGTSFVPFAKALESGGTVRGLRVPAAPGRRASASTSWRRRRRSSAPAASCGSRSRTARSPRRRRRASPTRRCAACSTRPGPARATCSSSSRIASPPRSPPSPLCARTPLASTSWSTSRATRSAGSPSSRSSGSTTGRRRGSR
jgi:aspartyl-tRNA synthetase